MRTIYRTCEFDDFYESVSDKVQIKIKYALNVISEFKIVNTKLVKKLTNTEFFELRISIDNEYRIILFAVDNENFYECEKIILLNGFVKKSTKDYKKEIIVARRILRMLSYENKD